uniref:Translation elongation factor EF1B beta/delta subunit guanine nucleotide exchange domain-containing protein n=1 Tax=Macaca nemestrina TaxID=9545 RepID=A0A2K6C432_MACNE
MATNFLVHEKIWFDKFKHDVAERRFYEQMNGPVAGASPQALGRLAARLNVLEKSLPGHQATAPQTQHVSPMRQVESPAKKPATAAEDDEDDDTDLLGSDSEAAQLREERLQQYAEKKVKKPALVARSSILLDIKPWDGETAMAHLEACVRFIQLDGLVWEASQLVPVGYGIWKLQIQCVVEDKVETDLGEEEITKFEERVQSVDMQLSTRSEA